MYDFKRIEQDVLDFWEQNAIFEKSLENRKDAKRFVFFEGPPTANGHAHMGHFEGRVFKDIFNRYKTMRGFFVLRKAGWDTHGLPVEIEIEKELGLKNKKDIENYGIAKFNNKARENVWKYKKEWEDFTKRMGFWLDMNDPYITYENNYMESVWNIIQQIWNKKLLYLAHKVVPFCVRCGTPLSSHEVAQGYKLVKERSVYLKFKVKSTKFKNTFILAWTTTPWTLPGNVALAVGASIRYQVVSIKGKDELYILAEDLVSKVLNTEYEIHNTILGSDLVGLEYEPLFDIKELKSPTSYRVYDADFVSTEDGTGVVHTAVMYGEDDYNLGTKLDLPKIHTVTETGVFAGVSKELDGRYVKKAETENIILEHLQKGGLLLKTEDYEHDYPFCWRCDSPLLYYAKNSWFIRMTALKEQLLKNNAKVNWIPEHIKEGRFGQWLKDGKDWAFSRERYWGTPLPIWKCQKCVSYKLIGSIEELEKNAISLNKNTYYTLRHGYTGRDEKNKMLIGSDLVVDKFHLTDEGRKQIELAAEVIKNNYEVDIIYASPFKRTMESADIVAKLIHSQVITDERLGEIKHGGCEGKPHRDCPGGERKTVDSKGHEEGESWNDVRKRMAAFMSEMEEKYTGKKILIVSHGDPLWLLYGSAEGATGAQIFQDGRGGTYHYPAVADFHELKWRPLPRNEFGELDLHRPYIDSIYLKCNDCGASMKKIPDLIDVWFDSGAMPYAQWHMPFENKDKFKEQFPADFIVEGIDQTRGWFYTLLAISTLLGKGNPYKNVMSLGHVLDDKGKKMSKSKGNVVSPIEAMDKAGADAARWYFYTINAPGEYKNFSMRDVEAKLKGFIFTLQNCIRFYELYQSEPSVEHKMPVKNFLDKWLVSRLNGLVAGVTSDLDKYDPVSAARSIEKFVMEDLSNWWLRRSRKRKEALPLLRHVLLELAKILSPFTPFMAEDMHKRLAGDGASVHLADWPELNKKAISAKLEAEMDDVRGIVTAGLALRKEKQIKVRQPLRSVSLARKTKFSSEPEDLIKEELNVKKIIYDKKLEAAVVLDTVLDQPLINEGYARELIRQIQDMRKEAKYKLDEKISGRWHSDDMDIKTAILEWSGEIAGDVLFEEFLALPAEGKHDKGVFDIEKELELAPQRKIWVGVKK